MASLPHARRLPIGRTLSIALLVLFGWVGVAQAGQVCFYKKSNYRKKSYCFDYDPNGAPMFGSKEYRTLRAPNNEIGSVKITGTGFPGMWIYDGMYDKKAMLITGDTPSLGNMNNEMSSWVIRNKGPASTKVRIFVRKVWYDGKDPDGHDKPDHLMFSRVWRGNNIVWNSLIQGTRLNGPKTWTGHTGANYRRDKNAWIPAVVHDWDFDIGQDRQITLAMWDCAGTCTSGLTPDRWQMKPPCATGQCTQRSGATVYPLGDLVLDLTKHREGESVTLTNGTVTAEVEIWKNPYYGERKTNRRDPSRVSIVGSTQSRTPAQFRDYVSGMKFTASPNDEPAYELVNGERAASLGPGECTVSYPNARAGGNKANVDIGSLTCVVPLADGVTVSVTPVYGGCNIASRGGGSEAQCEIGVFSSTLRVEHSIPGCNEQICEFSEELTVQGPNAQVCNSMSYDSYCQNAELNLVYAEVTVTDGNGNGVGAGVGVGVGAGAGVTVDDGVLRAEVKLKILVGAEVSFSIGYEENAKALYRIGERGVMYALNNRKAMGKRAADAFRAVHGKTGIKAFAGLTRVRQVGNSLSFAKDTFGAVGSFASALGQGAWKSASNFFSSATSWIPKF